MAYRAQTRQCRKLVLILELSLNLANRWMMTLFRFPLTSRGQNGNVERLIGSIRTRSPRPSDLSLEKDSPDFRLWQKLGPIATIPILGGLNHQLRTGLFLTNHNSSRSESPLLNALRLSQEQTRSAEADFREAIALAQTMDAKAWEVRPR